MLSTKWPVGQWCREKQVPIWEQGRPALYTVTRARRPRSHVSQERSEASRPGRCAQRDSVPFAVGQGSWVIYSLSSTSPSPPAPLPPGEGRRPGAS